MKQHPVVLVPCHRSHFDYVILSYIFHLNYLSPPHIAAGINLSFWPLGPLFRGAGAYFIRRSFDDNELYKAVFRSYLKFLIREGYTQEFFIEGGRSRTGKILTPKLGMLSAIVDAFTQGVRRDLYLVPVSIHYGRVVEEEAYQRELGGAEKEPESLAGLVRARRVLQPPSRHRVHHLRRADLAQRRARRAQGRVPPSARPGDRGAQAPLRAEARLPPAARGQRRAPSPARPRCRRPCCSACRTGACRLDDFVTARPRAGALPAHAAACASPLRSSATTRATSARTSRFLENGGLMQRLASEARSVDLRAGREAAGARLLQEQHASISFCCRRWCSTRSSRGLRGDGACATTCRWWLDLLRWEFPLPERDEYSPPRSNGCADT